MSAAKKKKLMKKEEFNSEWCSKYLVVSHNQGVVCLICQNMIAFMKEYNIKCHYATKYSSKFYEVLCQA